MLFIIVVSSLFTLRAVVSGLVYLADRDDHKARINALSCAIAAGMAFWGWSSL